MIMTWEDMLPEEGGQEEGQEEEGGGERGIMTIMGQEAPEGREPERWRSARNWLRKLPSWGIQTLREARKEGSVILPEMMRLMMREEEVKELEWAVGNEGAQMEVVWVGEGQRQAQTPVTPKLRDAARGAELIGGTVRQRGKKGYVAGKVTGFEGTEYEVRLSSGQQVKWSEEEVRHGWIEDQYIMRRG
jgi:hypothetical protein